MQTTTQQLVDGISDWMRCESPSSDPAALERMVEMMRAQAAAAGLRATVSATRAEGKHGDGPALPLLHITTAAPWRVALEAGTLVTPSLLTAEGFTHLSTAEQPVDVLVPREAVQEVEGNKVVFVRNEEGFELREVALGREDANGYEVVFGLDAGTEIAVGNAFSLRAELSKSEAGHAH